MSLPQTKNYDFDGEGEMLLIDKPLDWTSFQVVKEVRNLFGIRKVGHAGTLDPRATGLLILCTGKQTKSFDQMSAMEKEYTGTFELGIRTPSFDLETGVTERAECSTVTSEQIRHVAMGFVGAQLQTPPMYSAVKYHGKPLYKYARKGRTVERAPKEIDISELDIVSFDTPVVRFRVVCSKGTYIRSLIHDIGERLGCGATLTSLRRTRIGEHRIEHAMTIEELEALRDELRDRKHALDENCVPA